ncbi:MAG: hypothetical protein KGV51_05330 [Moraxellaceae bacterium]|nr:hypothetical protein [Moraxellaceae bacterium]
MQYDRAKDFKNSLAKVEKNGKEFIINKQGEIVKY